MPNMLKMMLATSVLAAAVAGTATAAVPVGPLPTNTTVNSLAFISKTNQPLHFNVNVLGYLTLDGQNTYEDDFSVVLNDITTNTKTQVFLGTFNLGGGGNNVVYSPSSGVTFSGPATDGSISRTGGNVVIDAATTAPLNTTDKYSLTFGYTSLSGDGYAGFQTLGDEGWGIKSYSIAGTNNVPEPATWLLMLAGFGGMGAALRMRRRSVTAAAAV